MHNPIFDGTAVQSFSHESILPPTMPAYEASDDEEEAIVIFGLPLHTSLSEYYGSEQFDNDQGTGKDDSNAFEIRGLTTQDEPGIFDQRAQLASNVMAYCALRDDWDSEDGVAPSREAIDDALAFIRLIPLRATLPKPMVSGDGEVGFYWKTDNVYIDVGFYGDNQISYYARAKAENLEVEGPKPYSRKSIPKDLIDIIRLA